MKTRTLTASPLITLVVATGVAFLAWQPTWAGAPTDQLRASVDQVIRVLGDATLRAPARTQERRAALRRQADHIFDFSETARRALGAHWPTLAEADRREFVSLFADLLERAYVSKIERYSGEKITYAGDIVDGDTATVRSRFAAKNGTDVAIDYRMHRIGDRWLVYDVSVEGVSLVANYRTQFNRIIQAGSFQELMRRLKASEVGAPEASDTRDGGPKS